MGGENGQLSFHPNKMNPFNKFSSVPLVLASAWKHRQLIVQITKREVVGRYRGSAMGLLWSFFNPILMLTVYTVVFSVVFKARWGETASDSKTEFAIILFTGLIIYGLFAECINRAPGLILSNVNYVKKVIFPLEILPWVSLGTALFHAAVSTVVLLLFYALVNHSLHWTIVFLPVLLTPLLLLIMGISWFLSSIGVFLRDVGQTTGIITNILMFLSPVFYPASALPADYRPLLYLNPLTFFIEQARDIMIWGKFPDWQGLGLFMALGIFVSWAGHFWFQKTRKGFADVL